MNESKRKQKLEIKIELKMNEERMRGKINNKNKKMKNVCGEGFEDNENIEG